MEEKVLLKDLLFNKQKVEIITNQILALYPKFDKNSFVDEVVKKFPLLELKARITWIAECLKKHLPSDYKKAVQIIIASLPPENDPELTDNDFGDFIYAPYGEFVAKNGCKKEYLHTSLSALYEITKRFSMEDSIRYFINTFPVETLNTLLKWAKDPNYHVRRLCSEGTRPMLPWSQKISLSVEEPLQILNFLYYDKTRYVTRSVANHLNDISKKEPKLVLSILDTWRKSKKQNVVEMDYITKHALRTLIKKGDKEALTMLGFDHSVPLQILNISLTERVTMNTMLSFSFDLEASSDVETIIDYVIHFQTKLGKCTSKKVFKLTKVRLKKNEPTRITKNHMLREKMTTRILYPGEHMLEIQVNGAVHASKLFLVEK